MNIIRHEVRTGLLVTVSLVAIVGILIFLGAPGVFTPQHTLGIYFDNAAGIKLGTPVMLAGRSVGQVTSIQSPVSKAGRPKNMPQAEALIEVRVDKEAQIYNVCKVQLASYNFLGELVIDFTGGEEASGRAAEWTYFEGERPGGLADAGTQIVQKLDPAINQLVTALQSLEKTANNVTAITNEGADLSIALAEIRQIAKNLNTISGPDGSLQKALSGLEHLAKDDGTIDEALTKFQVLIGPESNLAKALANIQKITDEVGKTDDIAATLRNFRQSSEKLNSAIGQLKDQFTAVGGNLQDASETVKKQPWRLVWPSTKKYPQDEPPPKRRRNE